MSPRHTFHILSDTEAVDAGRIMRAALAECGSVEHDFVEHGIARAEQDVGRAYRAASEGKGIVAYFLARSDLREAAQRYGRHLNVPSIDLIGPTIVRLTDLLEISPNTRPELFHQITEDYFRRIEAIEFAVAHDDGRRIHELDRAEIVLIGVSRTSKTPLSMYLASHGWLVANVPLVLNMEPPAQIFEADPRRVFGLTIRPDRLAMLRRVRLTRLGLAAPDDYADLDYVRRDLRHAQEIFERGKGWAVIDVSGKSIEESANEILDLLHERADKPGDKQECPLI